MRKAQLVKVWKQLDSATEALERLAEYDEGKELLEEYENRIDFSALVMLKNDVEDLIEKKSRKPIDLK